MTVPSIQTILVPQGPEYKAVERALSRISGTKPLALPIPIGVTLRSHLQKWLNCASNPPAKVLVIGLCGSLTECYTPGDLVLYQDCIYQDNALALVQACDRTLTSLLHSQLKPKSLVRALTSDRLIWSAEEKRYLGERYGADVVDMEGFAVLDVLAQTEIAVAMVRVISDDAQHDIPDLSSSITPDGRVQFSSLASTMLRQPQASTRLIRGSLRGLKVLQEITTTLFS